MNIVLFNSDEVDRPLPLGDSRAQHVLLVLKRRLGESFDAGLINGPRGRGTVKEIGPETLTCSFAWGEPPPPPEPVTVLVGLPRPQTARDILRDATTLGAAAMHFVVTEKGERNYAQSSLWTTGEWQRHVVAGAAQAFDTRVPAVTSGRPLADMLMTLPGDTRRLALDNYESAGPLAQLHIARETQIVLAIGPERGWSARDRELLRSHRFELVHLGPRVLRCETAVVAALTLVQAARARA